MGQLDIDTRADLDKGPTVQGDTLERRVDGAHLSKSSPSWAGRLGQHLSTDAHTASLDRLRAAGLEKSCDDIGRRLCKDGRETVAKR